MFRALRIRLQDIEEADTLLAKFGLVRKVRPNQIMFVKLQNDRHHWPVKVTYQCHLQAKESAQKKRQNDSFEEDYTPGKDNQQNSNKRRQRNKKRMDGQTYELVFRVMYFGCQSFAYVQEHLLIPYCHQIEQQLAKIRKPELEKALKYMRKSLSNSENSLSKNQTSKASTYGKKNQKNYKSNYETVQTTQANQNQNHHKTKNSFSQKLFLSKNSCSKQEQSYFSENSFVPQPDIKRKKQEKNKKILQKRLQLQQFLEFRINTMKSRQSESPQIQLFNQKLTGNLIKNPICQMAEQNLPAQKNFLGAQALIVQQTDFAIKKQQSGPPQKSEISTQTVSIVKEEYVPLDHLPSDHLPLDHFSLPLNELSQTLTIDNSLQANQQSDIAFDTPCFNHCIQTQIRQEYILDNVLYKNKYSIMGIFINLLEDLTTKILWFQAKNNFSLSQAESKKIMTLNKILVAEIFTKEELKLTQSIQKMLNILKICQINKFCSNPQNEDKKKIIKTCQNLTKYLKILFQLNNKQSQASELTLVNLQSNIHQEEETQVSEYPHQEYKQKLNLKAQKISESQVCKGIRKLLRNDLWKQPNKRDNPKQELRIDYKNRISVNPRNFN